MTASSKCKSLIFILFLVSFGLPLSFVFLSSLSAWWMWPALFPKSLTFLSWVSLFENVRFASALSNTIYLGGLVVFLNLLLAIPAGKALAHYDFKWKSEIDIILMLPILVPGLGIAMGVHFLMIRLGLANSLLGVALIHLIPTLPYSIRMFRMGFENLGIRWEEQARSLGIPPRAVMWGIWFPLLLPTIRGVIFLTFIISLSQYILTALIGGGNVLTLALVYFPYFNSSNWSIIASFTLLFALLPLGFWLLTEFLIYFLNPFSKQVNLNRVFFTGGTRNDK